MEIVVILSHLMSKEGKLDKESLKRIEKGVEICTKRNCLYLVTSGWAYRKDCSLAIGEVAARYIIKNFQLDNCKIIFDTNSRDTVGDAFFLRKKLSDLKYSKLTVITSDFHIKRTRKIFTKFFQSTSLEFIGIKTSLNIYKNILQKENSSLDSFKKTFHNIDFNNDEQICKVLTEKHPYYNGNVFEKIQLKVKN